MTQFKPGDRVTHNPTGAEWTLADAVEAMDRFSGRADPIADVVKACAAFREATK